MMSEKFKYDVFLSHSSRDKVVVRELAQRLKSDGLRVWFDEWEIQPGDMIGKKVDQGLQESRVLVLAMSQQAFQSEWATLESGTFRFRDPTNQSRRFIPLRLDNAEITEALKQFAYVDWRKKSDFEYVRLREACRAGAGLLDHVAPKEEYSGTSRIIYAHSDGIYAIAVTRDGLSVIADVVRRHLVKIPLFDLASQGIIEANSRREAKSSMFVRDLSVSANGRLIASCSSSASVQVWDLESMKRVRDFASGSRPPSSVAFFSDDQRIVSGSYDGAVKVWKLDGPSGPIAHAYHHQAVKAVAVTRDDKRIISGSEDCTIRMWDADSGKEEEVFRGHAGGVTSLAVASHGLILISGSEDKTLRLWSLASARCIGTLEGHTARVMSVAISSDSTLAVSGSVDKSIRVWNLSTGQCLRVLRGHSSSVRSVAFVPNTHQVISASVDGTIRCWAPNLATPQTTEDDSFRYTNAKVLLVGESGVGKTGLAIRLTQDQFRLTASTDGAWATQLRVPSDTESEIEREVWLWDFAGQADYRLIHQLYVDVNALAVVVFNPQSENPFEALGQWDSDLQRSAGRPLKRLLVAGRCDRGGLMISRRSMDRFIEERGFAAFIETSALTGAGCDELREAIIREIPWDDIPWIASPRIFQRLKEEILNLKEEGITLLRMAELKQQLEMRLPGSPFTLEELRAAVGLLANPGVVWQLNFGDFILLQPERLNAYAYSVVRSVRAHTEEIGCIAEEDVLKGRLDYQDMERLPEEEERSLLETMHQAFVNRGLCLREPTEKGTLLVFPSYFRRERPELEGHPAILMSYKFMGQLDEIYATLVVRLHHTLAFDKDQLWRYAADFRTPGGKRVGLKMTKRAEGEAELVVYFESDVADDIKVTFIRYIHEHIKAKAQHVARTRYYVCPKCSTPVENYKVAMARLEQGKKDIVCVNCENRILLWDLIEQKFASEELQQIVRNLDEQARRKIDNESRELILVGHTFAIAGEAGQIYRQYANSDHGIDGEIEFKDDTGKASGKRLYLQLKSGDSYLHKRKRDGAEVFTIKKERWAAYWQGQAYPVMLVIRTSDGQIRWMNVTEYLQKHDMESSQIVFEGEAFNAMSVAIMRDRMLTHSK